MISNDLEDRNDRGRLFADQTFELSDLHSNCITAISCSVLLHDTAGAVWYEESSVRLSSKKNLQASRNRLSLKFICHFVQYEQELLQGLLKFSKCVSMD